MKLGDLVFSIKLTAALWVSLIFIIGFAEGFSWTFFDSTTWAYNWFEYEKGFAQSVYFFFLFSILFTATKNYLWRKS